MFTIMAMIDALSAILKTIQKQLPNYPSNQADMSRCGKVCFLIAFEILIHKIRRPDSSPVLLHLNTDGNIPSIFLSEPDCNMHKLWKFLLINSQYKYDKEYNGPWIKKIISDTYFNDKKIGNFLYNTFGNNHALMEPITLENVLAHPLSNKELKCYMQDFIDCENASIDKAHCLLNFIIGDLSYRTNYMKNAISVNEFDGKNFFDLLRDNIKTAKNASLCAYMLYWIFINTEQFDDYMREYLYELILLDDKFYTIHKIFLLEALQIVLHRTKMSMEQNEAEFTLEAEIKNAITASSSTFAKSNFDLFINKWLNSYQPMHKPYEVHILKELLEYGLFPSLEIRFGEHVLYSDVYEDAKELQVESINYSLTLFPKNSFESNYNQDQIILNYVSLHEFKINIIEFASNNKKTIADKIANCIISQENTSSYLYIESSMLLSYKTIYMACANDNKDVAKQMIISDLMGIKPKLNERMINLMRNLMYNCELVAIFSWYVKENALSKELADEYINYQNRRCNLFIECLNNASDQYNIFTKNLTNKKNNHRITMQQRYINLAYSMFCKIEREKKCLDLLANNLKVIKCLAQTIYAIYTKDQYLKIDPLIEILSVLLDKTTKLESLNCEKICPYNNNAQITKLYNMIVTKKCFRNNKIAKGRLGIVIFNKIKQLQYFPVITPISNNINDPETYYFFSIKKINACLTHMSQYINVSTFVGVINCYIKPRNFFESIRNGLIVRATIGTTSIIFDQFITNMFDKLQDEIAKYMKPIVNLFVVRYASDDFYDNLLIKIIGMEDSKKRDMMLEKILKALLIIDSSQHNASIQKVINTKIKNLTAIMDSSRNDELYVMPKTKKKDMSTNKTIAGQFQYNPHTYFADHTPAQAETHVQQNTALDEQGLQLKFK